MNQKPVVVKFVDPSENRKKNTSTNKKNKDEIKTTPIKRKSGLLFSEDGQGIDINNLYKDVDDAAKQDLKRFKKHQYDMSKLGITVKDNYRRPLDMLIGMRKKQKERIQHAVDSAKQSGRVLPVGFDKILKKPRKPRKKVKKDDNPLKTYK